MIDLLDAILGINKILHRVKPIVDGPTGPVAVSLGEAQSLASGQSAIPVTLDANGGIAGVQMAFTFDPAHLQVGVPQLAERAAGMTVISHVQDGTLKLVVYSATGDGIAAGNGPILLIPVMPDAHAEPVLTLADVVLASRQADAIPVRLEQSTVKVAPLPTAFGLKPNRPNPFNPTTRIAYDVPQAAHIVVAVYNLLGQEVARLVDEPKTPGRYVIAWDGRNGHGEAVASGVYLYRLMTSAGFSQTRRMALVK